MQKKCDVVIIGGGVIGTTLAFELATRGVQVTLIDKGEIGYGCSYGNAGWLTPCFAMPLPMPGMLLKSIGWLLNPSSPLYIKPKPSVLLFRWLARFLLSMNERHLQRSVEALVELSRFSLDAYKKWNGDFEGAFSFDQKGLLMAAQSEGGYRAAVHEMELVGPHGVVGRVLSAEETKLFEPSLTGALRGSVYFPDEAHVEPLSVVRTLAAEAAKKGAEICPRTELFDFIASGDRIEAVRTTHGDLYAEQFVLATGAWSARIAKMFGLRVPVMGGKGYAMISRPLTPGPRVPLMLIEKKIAVTPRKDTVRIAGTLELVDEDESITKRRVENIVQGAREFLNLPQEFEALELWRGLRPCTPDGVPIVSRARSYQNLVVSTGHQMLGLQTAPASARLAADILLEAKPSFDLYPFRANRF